jgi:hypothetical protein
LLEQAMVAEHLDRGAPACRGQLDVAIALAPDEPFGGQPLQHRRRRRRRHAQPLRHRRRRNARALLVLEDVDRLQVVSLDLLLFFIG